MPRLLLRLFLRIVSRNSEVYVLKIITLAIAFASSALVLLFSLNEFEHDRFHRDPDSIFRIIKKNTSEVHNGNRLSNKLRTNVYDILNSTSADSQVVSRLTIMNGLTIVSDRGKHFSVKVHAADASISEIFSFNILHGSLKGFHENANMAILSSSAAHQIFGDVKANGKNMNIYSYAGTISVQVAAVYEDFPKNSHEELNVFIRFNEVTLEFLGFNAGESGMYVRAINSDVRHIENILESKLDAEPIHYLLQPLSEIYFGPRVLGEDSRHGDRYSIWILLSLTALILFLAGATYVNLTSLTLPSRSKELAIRKLAGTSQPGLVLIFFKESLVLVSISFLLGTLLLFLMTGIINAMFSMNVAALLVEANPAFFIVIAGVLLLLILSPLFLTFRFIKASPKRLLSTDIITFPGFTRTITIMQLGISISLIVACLVIKRQINYSLLKEPGRNHDQVVYLNYPNDLTKEGLSRMRAGWQMNHPNIVDVIALSQLPDRINSREIKSPFYYLFVDPFFPVFFQLNMIRGNWFRPNMADSFMVFNERAMREQNITDTSSVIGLVEDINSHFNQPLRPIKFRMDENSKYNYLCVRILEVDIRRTIDYLSDYFNGARIHILNKRFEEWLYYQDRLNAFSNFLGIIGALLSCCAVYGLSVRIVRDKLKQIAVHKILGANSGNIAWLLARQLISQTLLAILIFGPVTYIFVKEFLRNFVYSTHVKWHDAVLPTLYCLGVIMVLSGFQALTLNRRDLTSALKK